jgi:hypothetical protein
MNLNDIESQTFFNGDFCLLAREIKYRKIIHQKRDEKEKMKKEKTHIHFHHGNNNNEGML